MISLILIKSGDRTCRPIKTGDLWWRNNLISDITPNLVSKRLISIAMSIRSALCSLSLINSEHNTNKTGKCQKAIVCSSIQEPFHSHIQVWKTASNGFSWSNFTVLYSGTRPIVCTIETTKRTLYLHEYMTFYVHIFTTRFNEPYVPRYISRSNVDLFRCSPNFTWQSFIGTAITRVSDPYSCQRAPSLSLLSILSALLPDQTENVMWAWPVKREPSLPISWTVYRRRLWVQLIQTVNVYSNIGEEYEGLSHE